MPRRLSEKEVAELAKKFFGVEALTITELESYYDQNFYIKDSWGKEYVFKSSSSGIKTLDFQNKMMEHLAIRKLPVPRALASLQKTTIVPLEHSLVRLLTFMPGKSVVSDNYAPELLKNVGKLAGTVDLALKDFSHPTSLRPGYVWDLQNALLLRNRLKSIGDKKKREAVTSILDQYEKKVVPLKNSLRKGVTHNDINEFNILSTDGWHITGLIDFGDAAYTHYVNNLAITLAHFMLRQADPIQKAPIIYKEYNKVFPLASAEKEVIPILIMARLATLIAVSSDMVKKNTANSYIKQQVNLAWKVLKLLIQLPENEILHQLEH